MDSRLESPSSTLPFDQFWRWLTHHYNCVLRAGTPEVMLFDSEQYHWTMFVETDDVHIVQLVRGKELVGEVVVYNNEISYVQASENEEGEHLFECIVESKAGREAAYLFVLAHGYDTGEAPQQSRRWTH